MPSLQSAQYRDRLVQKKYSKGKISFELLAHVDPVLVEAACPHAKALLEKLRAV